jgi:anti-anti-sigma factor
MTISGLELDVRQEDEAIIIAAKGELDMASAEAFATELERAAQAGAQLVVVDLSFLQFMDSSGVGTLVRAEQEAKASGQRLVIVRGPRQVEQLLELTGLAQRLTIVDSLSEAREAR